MTLAGALFLILVEASCAAAGAAIVAAVVLVRRRPIGWKSYLAAKVGFLVTLATITYSAVLPAREAGVPWTWELGVYFVGLILVAVGCLGIAADTIRRTERRSAREGG